MARSTLINFFQIIPAIAVVAVSVAEVPGAVGELFNSTSPISLRSRPWMVTSKSSPYRTPHPLPTSQCRWLRGSRGSQAALLPANMGCRSSSLLLVFPFIDGDGGGCSLPVNYDCRLHGRGEVSPRSEHGRYRGCSAPLVSCNSPLWSGNPVDEGGPLFHL